MNSLKALIPSTSKTAWVKFDDKISFQLRFVSRAKLRVLTDQCTTTQYDPRSKVHQPKVDSEKLTKLFLSDAVLDWKGVTPRTIGKYVLIETSSLTEEEMDAAVPFSQEELVPLVSSSNQLDGFLYEASIDPQCFNSSAVSVTPEIAAKN